MAPREIAIVGPGCPLCLEAESLVRAVVEKHNIAATVELVTDFQTSLDLSVFAPPGVMIDQAVRTVGRVPDEGELLGWLEQPAPGVEKIIFSKRSLEKNDR